MFKEKFLQNLYFEALEESLNQNNFNPENIFSIKKSFLGFNLYYGYTDNIGYYGYLKNKYNNEFLFFLISAEEDQDIFIFKEKLFKSNIKGIDSLNDFFDLKNLKLISVEAMNNGSLKNDYWKKLGNEEASFENFLKIAFCSWRISKQSLAKGICYFIANKLAEGKKVFSYELAEKVTGIHIDSIISIIHRIWVRSSDRDVFSFGKNYVIATILFKVEKENLFKFDNVDYDLYFELLEHKFLEYEASIPDNLNRRRLRGFNSYEEEKEYEEEMNRLTRDFYENNPEELFYEFD